jgi:hypothetical protein
LPENHVVPHDVHKKRNFGFYYYYTFFPSHIISEPNSTRCNLHRLSIHAPLTTW